jgi:hypothetical protein
LIATFIVIIIITYCCCCCCCCCCRRRHLLLLPSRAGTARREPAADRALLTRVQEVITWSSDFRARSGRAARTRVHNTRLSSGAETERFNPGV